MPISDAYVAQYLLQQTCAEQDALLWSERDSKCFSANLHGVEVELYTLRERVYLTLLAFPERIDICEPVNHGSFYEKYDSEADATLSRNLRELMAKAERQCAKRLNRSDQEPENIRESIYRRLIGLGV